MDLVRNCALRYITNRTALKKETLDNNIVMEQIVISRNGAEDEIFMFERSESNIC